MRCPIFSWADPFSLIVFVVHACVFLFFFKWQFQFTVIISIFAPPMNPDIWPWHVPWVQRHLSFAPKHFHIQCYKKTKYKSASQESLLWLGGFAFWLRHLLLLWGKRRRVFALIGWIRCLRIGIGQGLIFGGGFSGLCAVDWCHDYGGRLRTKRKPKSDSSRKTTLTSTTQTHNRMKTTGVKHHNKTHHKLCSEVTIPTL